MKKCAVFVLTFLLLFSAAGLSFTVHFCGDDIASVSSGFDVSSDLREVSEKGCCEKKADEKKSCCSDKLVKIKAKSEVVSKQDLKHQIFFPPVGNLFTFAEISFAPVAKVLGRYHRVPHGPPLYKLYHKLIFYA